MLRSVSLADLATTVIFTDHPIVFRSTPVRAAHVAELQQAANAVRTLAGLAPVTFTPPSPGSQIRSTDVSTLRTAIDEAFWVLNYRVTWPDGVAAGQAIKSVHVQQLRNVMK